MDDQNFIESVLKGDGVDSYIQYSLENGNSLSETILGKHDLSKWEKYTLLPDDIDVTAIEDYGSGGLADFCEREFIYSWMISALEAFLQASSCNVVICENNWAEPGYSYWQKSSVPIYALGEEVYHCIYSKSSNDQKYIRETMNAAERL